jgi:hypothetical protein
MVHSHLIINQKINYFIKLSNLSTGTLLKKKNSSSSNNNNNNLAACKDI